MRFDLVIKQGTIIDGSGAGRYQADIGVADGKIAAIGTLHDPSDEVINARDLVVAPGFIDGHTHLDAQVFWEPLGSSSCYQGVTTAVFGNCGFTLAPVKPEHIGLLLEHFEAAEALPLEALRSGIDFRWESFGDYFDVLEALPKGINYASYVGHSALRINAMGDRAFESDRTPEDMAAMVAGLEAALRAGAIGFSSSRVSHHRLRDGRLISSGHAHWQEVCTLVEAMAALDVGIFELAREKIVPGEDYDFPKRLGALAVKTGRPTTLGVFHAIEEPGAAKAFMSMIDEAVRAGARMFAQVHTNTMYNYFSFRTAVPFNHVEAWSSLQSLSLDDRRRRLEDPSQRAGLIAALDHQPADQAADFGSIDVVRNFQGENLSLETLAKQWGCHPVEAMIEEALAQDLRRLFRIPFANVSQADTLALLAHPHAAPTFSDAGAHVSEIADSCIPSVLLGHWVREKSAFTLEQAVHRLTAKMAGYWGLEGRGLLRPGYQADLVIFDPDRIAPAVPEILYDFPRGMPRLMQRCDGIEATIVNGRVLLRRGEPAGGFPGELIKGPLAA